MPRRRIVGCAVVLFLLSIYQITHCATVCDNFYAGTNDVTTKDNNVDNNAGMSYLMTSGLYTFGCCGVIDQWRVSLDKNGTVAFQVWRPFSGSTYKLVGENSYTASGAVILFTGTIPTTQQITIIPGDVIGWWTSGVDMVKYKFGSGEENGNLYQPTADLSVSTILGWSSSSANVTTKNTRTYAIRADYIARILDVPVSRVFLME